MQFEPTVYVVDDNAELRESLRWLLESVGTRVETYDSAQSFLDAYDTRNPGCLILDIRMPGMSGLELQEKLSKLTSDLHIVFLTGHASVPIAVRAMRDGAVDFFEKPVDEQMLLDRVQGVLKTIGEQQSKKMDRAMLEARLELLTPRERQVMDEVIQGKRTKAIAADLGVSTRTIEAHRAKIMEKMRAGSVGELISMVMELRIEQ
ncbi:response regulator transcription factor [Endothiovibrio diazotrophicus]